MGFGILFVTDAESAKKRKARFIARGGLAADEELPEESLLGKGGSNVEREGPRLRKFERKRLRRLAEEGEFYFQVVYN